MSKSSRRCKHCKGKGIIVTRTSNNIIIKIICFKCEGAGIELSSEIEEQFKDSAEFDGTISHKGDNNFIEFEEDDYEY
jgi:DnaJ-class molecular chaperone